MYVRNAWYVACTPDEIAGKPLGRTICGERMVLFRGEGGAVAALEDFCPHRGAPLSLGTRARRRPHRLRLPRPGDGRRRQAASACRASACGPTIRAIRRSSATASSGSGRARRRSPTRRSCTTCPGPRAPSWAYGGGLYHIDVRLPADDRQPDGPDARDLRARDQHRPGGDRGSGAGDARRRRLGDHQPLHGRTSWRRRSGAPRCAATTSPTTCRATAGRSAASRRRAT